MFCILFYEIVTLVSDYLFVHLDSRSLNEKLSSVFSLSLTTIHILSVANKNTKQDIQY